MDHEDPTNDARRTPASAPAATGAGGAPRRKPVLAAVATVLVMVLVAGLALSLVLWNRDRRHLDQFARLGDAHVLQELLAGADNFWAGFPDNLPEMEAWLASAQELRGRLPEHRRWLEELKATKSSPLEKWQTDVLGKLVDGIEKDLDGAQGARVRVESLAGRAKRGLPSAAEREALWSQAIAAIEKEPKYKALKVAPLAGLIPLGPDPASGLWEFAHPLTGDIPRRDPSTQQLAITGETGLVLVLLPGGKFTMGAQRDNKAAPNYDRLALDAENPTHDVTLSPFLVSKYEMTQGQWLRIFQVNPSWFKAGDGTVEDPLSRPVENVSWEEATEACWRMGLVLPTEGQWEYACRAGTTTPSYGPPDDVAWHNANAKGRSHPVGTRLPNAFGLHDTLGNVWEWCADAFDEKAYSKRQPAVTDPQGPTAGQTWVLRGGAWFFDSTFCRAALRYSYAQTYRHYFIGLRPGRTL